MDDGRKTSGSLRRRQRRRQVLMALGVVLLALLGVYAVVRPDPKEKEVERLKGAILGNVLSRDNREMAAFAGQPGQPGQPGAVKDPMEDYDSIKLTVGKLDPDTRKRIFRDVLRARLVNAREQTANLSEEKKREIVQKMVQDVRDRYAKMPGEKRAQTKADAESAKGQERTREALDFYFKEFSAKERELMDPLVNEMLTRLNNL